MIKCINEKNDCKEIFQKIVFLIVSKFFDGTFFFYTDYILQIIVIKQKSINFMETVPLFNGQKYVFSSRQLRRGPAVCPNAICMFVFSDHFSCISQLYYVCVFLPTYLFIHYSFPYSLIFFFTCQSKFS